MKRALTLTLLLGALNLSAGEAKTSETKKSAEPAQPAATLVEVGTADTSTPVAAGDSPLVAAAKRANRRAGKSKIVITNDNLVAQNSGSAHMTTTTSQKPINVPPPTEPSRPTPEMVQADQRAKAHAAQQQRETEAAKVRAAEEQKYAERAQRAEDGFDGGQGDDADELVAGSEDQKPPQH